MGWGDEFAPPTAEEHERSVKAIQERYQPKVDRLSVGELRAIKSRLEAELGVEEAEGADAWIAAELAKADRYRLLVASRMGRYQPRTTAEVKAVKLAEIELQLAKRGTDGRVVAVK